VRAQTGSLQNPSEPQKFEIATGESAGFGFVVSQPGPIVIRAQWQGVPLIVSLSGPLAQPIEKSGSGSVDLSYTVSADDVRRGVVWKVSLRSASAPLRPVSSASVLIDSHNAVTLLRVAKTEAQGTVTIQHPPGDMRQAEQQLKATIEQNRPADLSQLRDQLQQTAQMRQAQFQKVIADQQAARAQQLMQSVHLKASPAQPAPIPQFHAGMRQMQAQVPTISSLSASEGQPGDPVLISGSGFGGNAGEVHFIVNPSMDLKAKVDYWSATQIMTSVPVVDKILSNYNGQVYLQQGAEKSGSVPFKFNPGVQFLTLTAADAKGDDLGIKDPVYWRDIA